MEGSGLNSLSPDSAVGEGSTPVPVVPPIPDTRGNLQSPASSGAPAPGADSSLAGRPAGSGRTIQYDDVEDGIAQLPPYARSLLKIKVPVSVMLAESQQTIETIMNIGPGSILHFSKSCEDTLALEVAGHKIAVGETVKIGDKFGLWITSIILPDERFWVIGRSQKSKRAK